MPSSLAHSGPTRLSGSPLVAVVDDDRAVVSSLDFALGVEGYQVVAYYDAQSYLDGVTDYAEWPSANCLVVDFRLPGMNGIQLLEELRRRDRLPPHMLVASNPSRACRNWAIINDVPLVEKPFLDEALTEQIRAALVLSAPVLRP